MNAVSISSVAQDSISAAMWALDAVGLAFKEQVVENTVPTSDNDMGMDILVLADELLACTEDGQQALQS